jgi:hypothetical protein
VTDHRQDDRPPREPAPTPLVGYRDIPQPTGRRRGVTGWVILAVMTVAYLAWTLVVYFLEPGIR